MRAVSERIVHALTSTHAYLKVLFVEMPSIAWTWLKEHHQPKFRWEYLLGLATFILVVIGTIFAVLQWQLARTSIQLAKSSNRFAAMQLCLDLTVSDLMPVPQTHAYIHAER